MEGHEFFYSYIKGTLQCDFAIFLLTKAVDTDYDSRCRWSACVPTFTSESEKTEFLEFLKSVEIKPDKSYEQLVLDTLPNGEDGKRYKHQYPRAIAITMLLNRFRRERGDWYA